MQHMKLIFDHQLMRLQLTHNEKIVLGMSHQNMEDAWVTFKAISNAPAEDLPKHVRDLTTSIISDTIGTANSRQLLQRMVDQTRQISSPHTRILIGTNVLEALQPRVLSFEDQDTAFKEMLADAHEANLDYVSSAKVLQSITLTSSQRDIADQDKAKVWIRITRCYLEEDDPTNALTFLNRVKNQVDVITLPDESRLQFQLSQARISDSQRNFLDASASFHTLSEEPLIDQDERLQALSAAINCAILAPAGPKRVRQLARLYQDERAVHASGYGILQKIFLDRILTPQEVAAFSKELSPHQKAVTADGSTVLSKAVLEHNLLAVSRLYSNIHTDVLGEMLNVSPEMAEVYAAQMIEQGRLRASIDQIDGLIYFERRTEGKSGKQRSTTRDANIQALAEQIETVACSIKAEHPELFASKPVQC